MRTPSARLRRFSVLALFAVGFASLPAAAVELQKIATFALGDAACDDRFPDVAVRPGGTFLVVWERSCSPFSLAAQLYDVQGQPLGPRRDLGQGRRPQVVALADGTFVLSSLRNTPSPDDLERFAVDVRRLDAVGQPAGSPVEVRAPRADAAVWLVPARLAVGADGRLAVAWQEIQFNPFGIPITQSLGFVRFLSPGLAPAQATFLLGLATLEPSVDVAFEPSGRALVALSINALIGYLFDASGQPSGTGTPLHVGGGQISSFHPRLAPRAGGGWWLAWEEVQFPATSPERQDVLLATVASDGRLPNAAIQQTGLHNPHATEIRQAFGLDPDGNLLVAGRDLQGGLSGRLFDPLGRPISGLFRIAPHDPQPLGNVALAAHGAGGFLAVWEGDANPATPPPQPEQQGWNLHGALLRRPCTGSAVCLGPGAGQAVEISWTQNGQSGTGRGVRTDRDGALFVLANPALFDLAVRLDADGTLVWAAPTGAELRFRWTDVATGRLVTASKPRGRFASGRIVPPTRNLPAFELALLTEDRDPGFATTGADTAVCAPSPTALCLFGGRFKATMTWTHSSGSELAALAVPIADRQGTFIAGTGPGALVTLVDGRAHNGKIWVYLGGLSDAAYRVTVTDTTTGRARTYTNPAGRLSSSADRKAF